MNGQLPDGRAVGGDLVDEPGGAGEAQEEGEADGREDASRQLRQRIARELVDGIDHPFSAAASRAALRLPFSRTSASRRRLSFGSLVEIQYERGSGQRRATPRVSVDWTRISLKRPLTVRI